MGRVLAYCKYQKVVAKINLQEKKSDNTKEKCNGEKEECKKT